MTRLDMAHDDHVSAHSWAAVRALVAFLLLVGLCSIVPAPTWPPVMP